MTSRKAIVDYMWYKSDLLGGRRKYMLKSIEKDILKWSDNDAENVCKKIIDYLTNCTEIWIPLAEDACPYCLYTTCSHCFYGKVRGICPDENSVYRELNRYQDGWNNKKAIKILKKGLQNEFLV